MTLPVPSTQWILFVLLAVAMCGAARGESTPASSADQAGRIVSQHKAVFVAPPRGTPSRFAVDGPLLGNADPQVQLVRTELHAALAALAPDDELRPLGPAKGRLRERRFLHQ